MSSVKVDPDKLKELSARLGSLGNQVESAERDIYQNISGILRDLRGSYTERYVQQALDEVEDKMREITKSAKSVKEQLDKKADGLKQAAEVYLDSEKAANKAIQRQFVPPSSYYPKQGNVFGEGASAYLKDPLFEDPVVQQLHKQALNGSDEEKEEALKQLDAIFKARYDIARAQVAYSVYKAFGNHALMDGAHREAERLRKVLKDLGVSEDFYGKNVNLTHLYKGSPLTACSYDPSFQITKDGKFVPILMPKDNQYTYLLGLAMSGGAEGAWAKAQLNEIHKRLAEIGRAQVAWHEYKAENMENEMKGAHAYAVKLRTELKDKFSLSPEMVDDVDYRMLWTGAGPAGKALKVQETVEHEPKKPTYENTATDILLNPVYFSQVDPRWASMMYSKNNDKSQTIGTSACGPTSMAIILSTLLGREITPVELCDFAVKHGYRTLDSGTSWGFYKAVAKEYGLECVQTSSLSEVKKALGAGKSMVVSSMGKGHFTKGGHFIVINGMESKGDDIWFSILDPNSKNSSYGKDGKVIEGTKNDGKVQAIESVIKSESKQYWIFTNPKPLNVKEAKVKELSNNAVKFLHGSESYSAYVYKDQGGKDTIGYGHLIQPGEKFKEPMSEEEARALYNKDIKKFINAVYEFDTKYSLNLTQNQFDALVIFTYNLGENFWKGDSTLKKLLISGKYTNEELMKAFGMYHKVTEDGVKKASRGLYNRRIDEAEVFLYAEYKRDTSRPLP